MLETWRSDGIDNLSFSLSLSLSLPFFFFGAVVHSQKAAVMFQRILR